jgi:lipoprotein-anchoring transpeptidase ErfK/SrfK
MEGRVVGLTDYYSVLSQAVMSLDRNTATARNELYDRARRVLVEQLLRADEPKSPASKLHAERADFEAAIERIEAELARRDPAVSRARQERRDIPSRQESAGLDGASYRAKRLLVPAALSVLGATVILVIAMVGYSFLTDRSKDVARPDTSRIERAPDNRSVTHAAVTHPEELQPGIDGGSTDSGLPYFYRRQPVYYRTVYSPGMVLVDRSQRFLYLVQPNSVALRYGIGVGGECADTAGLLRITRKDEWPEWVPSPELIKRRSYPSRLAGGPGNPLGARALYLNNGIGIHGTNAPKSIGHAVSLGCFRMVNDDVVDLYQRVPTGTAVVVMN